MLTDSYNVWSVRDLVLTLSVCVFATFWILRNKSPRERLLLLLAGIVLILVNIGIVVIVGLEKASQGGLAFYDLFFWATTLVCSFFNKLVKPRKSERNLQQSETEK
jgi:hypothetical protein